MAGHTLTEICDRGDIPKSTVYDWLSRYKEFSDAYARAREIQADGLVDEILHISDEPFTEDALYEPKLANAEVQRNKLRADNRKWFAAKVLPKRYGDKAIQDVNINTGPDPLIEALGAHIPEDWAGIDPGFELLQPPEPAPVDDDDPLSGI